MGKEGVKRGGCITERVARRHNCFRAPCWPDMERPGGMPYGALAPVWARVCPMRMWVALTGSAVVPGDFWELILG